MLGKEKYIRTEPVLYHSSTFEVEIAVAKLKKYKPHVVIKFLQN
jgi:hypothetical protein